MIDSTSSSKYQPSIPSPVISRPARPPGPPRGIPGRHLFAFRREPLHYLQEMAQTYGDIVQLPFGRQPVFLLNHPDFIREVLVTRHHDFRKARLLQVGRRVLGDGLLTAEGSAHAHGRHLLHPAFRHERMTDYAQMMVDEAAAWVQALPAGAQVDMVREMAALTLLVAGKVFFDADLRRDMAVIQRALDDLLMLFDPVILPLLELAPWLPLPPMGILHKARARLDVVIQNMIGSHRQNSAADDLLALLLTAQDEPGRGLDEEAVRGHALTILLAGHETTANALAWTWWLLARHPRVEAKLHAELDAVLGDELPTPQSTPRLRYARMVLAESMRLYPPAWIIAREAVDDVEMGGYAIPAGSTVLMSQWVMHRDPRYFPAADEFQPERWMSDRADRRPKFAYFPFGGGPRACIGAQFAWTEGVLLLATIAQRRRFRPVSGHAVVPDPRVTLRPRGGLPMRVEEKSRGG